MISEDNTLCKIYTDILNLHNLKTVISSTVKTTETRDGLWIQDGTEVEARNNQDFGAADDFIGWPFTIEIEVIKPELTTDHQVVSLVSRLLEALWDKGARAVAACDYESELPRAGGIGGHA